MSIAAPCPGCGVDAKFADQSRGWTALCECGTRYRVVPRDPTRAAFTVGPRAKFANACPRCVSAVGAYDARCHACGLDLNGWRSGRTRDAAAGSGHIASVWAFALQLAGMVAGLAGAGAGLVGGGGPFAAMAFAGGVLMLAGFVHRSESACWTGILLSALSLLLTGWFLANPAVFAGVMEPRTDLLLGQLAGGVVGIGAMLTGWGRAA